MVTDLEKLLELARERPVSAADREAQRLSFAFGNTKIADPRMTRETIAKAAADLAEQPVTVALPEE